MPSFSRAQKIAFVAAVVFASIIATPAGAATNRAVNSRYGFSFTLPSKWLTVPLNKSDFNGLLTTAEKRDPGLANELTNVEKNAASEGIKYFAVGPVSGGVNPNINVSVQSTDGAPSGSAFFSAMDSEVKIDWLRAGAVDLNTSVRTLPFAKALVIRYTVPKKLFGVVEHGTQWYLEHNNHVFIVTITSGTSLLNASTSSTIENSWKWSKPRS